MSDDEVLYLIRELQAMQKRNPPTSKAWKDASRELKPLFREMARRYPNGVGPAVMS
jgi:hypothetical protein